MQAFLSAFLAVFMGLFSFFSNASLVAELKNKGDIEGYSDSVTMKYDIPDFSTDENGDFTVLQFTDTHFTMGLSFNDVYTMTKMETEIEKYKPTLVVMTGDMLDDGESGAFDKAYVLRTVSEMFEEHEQYWAYVPGNNDGMNHGTSADVAAYLSQYEHCIVYDNPEISGATQYSVDIYNGDTLTHSLVFLDTMDYDHTDSEHLYGYVHEDQVKWCENEIAKKQSENPDVKVSVFMHENTPAFAKAAESGEEYKTGYLKIDATAEKYHIPKNQALDDVLDKSGCVGLVAIGHVHPAGNRCCFYNNTYYHIASKTILNGTLITVHTDADSIKAMYDFAAI